MPPNVARCFQARTASIRCVLRLLTTALLCSGLPLLAQAPGTSTAPPPPVRAQFFAGSVTEVDEQHITVSRTLVGRAPEKRTFLIGAKTKMKKSLLALNARVTVRYQHLPEGDIALEIQVHPPARTVKPS